MRKKIEGGGERDSRHNDEKEEKGTALSSKPEKTLSQTTIITATTAKQQQQQQRQNPNFKNPTSLNSFNDATMQAPSLLIRRMPTHLPTFFKLEGSVPNHASPIGGPTLFVLYVVICDSFVAWSIKGIRNQITALSVLLNVRGMPHYDSDTKRIKLFELESPTK